MNLERHNSLEPVTAGCNKVCLARYNVSLNLKGGYLDFSHLTESKNIYITEIFVKDLYKSSITKTKRKLLMVFP